MFSKVYQRKLEIWETNFGRECGWNLERDGEVVAILTEPRWEEMFWDSYRIEIVTNDAKLRERLLSKEFWDHAENERLIWRNAEFGTVAEGAFPAGTPFPEPGRLTMRGLNVLLRGPSVFDRIVLWVRKWCANKMANKTSHSTADRA